MSIPSEGGRLVPEEPRSDVEILLTIPHEEWDDATPEELDDMAEYDAESDREIGYEDEDDEYDED